MNTLQVNFSVRSSKVKYLEHIFSLCIQLLIPRKTWQEEHETMQMCVRKNGNVQFKVQHVMRRGGAPSVLMSVFHIATLTCIPILFRIFNLKSLYNINCCWYTRIICSLLLLCERLLKNTFFLWFAKYFN